MTNHKAQVINNPLDIRSDETIVKSFAQHCHFGTIEVIDPKNVSNDAMEYFDGRSELFILPREYKRGNFERFFLINHTSNATTHVATQTKAYDGGDNGLESLTYVFNVDEKNKWKSHGEIRFELSNQRAYFREKPFTGSTQINEEHTGESLGIELLYVMNTISQSFYEFPLHSDTILVGGERNYWEELVRKGEAVLYTEREQDRFAFFNKDSIKLRNN